MASGADEDLPPPLPAIFGDHNVIRLQESALPALAVVTGCPVAREFDIVDPVGRQLGSISQQSGRLGTGWPQFAAFAYPAQQLAMQWNRTGLFGGAAATGHRGEAIGSVQRKWSLLTRRYELHDSAGRLFATVVSTWTKRGVFPVLDAAGQQRGEISKPYGGYTQEMVTQARRFTINFANHPWTVAQRALLLVAAVSIDFDVFESR
ncbi:MAG TPA: phospholipid scramblase-related protein, partial [Thermoanaerobaculia bacterium]|nr:phospholipid scramblase-related protein [Thermoanaerobaculia bacterium]